MTHSITEWLNCYPSNWKGVIVPEAMAHPAKYSSKLIRRIYEHILEQGWVREGDRIIDPFGGVALGALDAMRLGLHWTGMELESKFAGLGYLNITQWNARYSSLPHWGSARLLNGDSRKLLEVIGSAVQASVSSPPYADGSQYTGGDDLHPEKMQGAYYGVGISAAVSSPPYSDSLSTDLLPKEERVKRARELGFSDAANVSPIDMEKIGMRHQSDYGSTPGQLGAMKAQGFDAAVSSPPYNLPMSQDHNGSRGGQRGTTLSEPGAFVKYGNTEEQLEGMSMDGFDAAISSPPYEDSDQNYKAGWKRFHNGREPLNANDIQREAEYGTTPGQLSASGDFWLAARTIVEQVYLALEPGGHACWVVKDYVKNKKVVPFCDQWRQLCEAVGFVTLHEHHAMLVHHKGTQHTLDGGTIERKTESKSFFRRLAEKNGGPRIDYETVYCMEKPAQEY